MADIDLTWANPTEAQNVAFEIAMKQKPRDLTEFQAAEFICMADKSLWYVQAKNWAETPPSIGKAALIWKAACKYIVDIVNLGYDEQQKTWWPMAKLGKVNEIAAKMLILMDFGTMLPQYRQQSMDIVSRGFEIFLDIVLSKNWEKRYKQILNSKLQGVTTKQVSGRSASCVNPFCDIQVDRTKKKSGACSQAHVRYYCSQCKCWHHWGTKIAAQHQEFYVCDWSKEAAQQVRDGLNPNRKETYGKEEACH